MAIAHNLLCMVFLSSSADAQRTHTHAHTHIRNQKSKLIAHWFVCRVLFPRSKWPYESMTHHGDFSIIKKPINDQHTAERASPNSFNVIWRNVMRKLPTKCLAQKNVGWFTLNEWKGKGKREANIERTYDAQENNHLSIDDGQYRN